VQNAQTHHFAQSRGTGFCANCTKSPVLSRDYFFGFMTMFVVFCAKCTKIAENTPVFGIFFVQSAQLSGK